MTYEVQIARDTYIRFNHKPTTKELFRKMAEVGYFNTPQKVECMAMYCYRGSYKLAFNALYDLDKEGLLLDTPLGFVKRNR